MKRLKCPKCGEVMLRWIGTGLKAGDNHLHNAFECLNCRKIFVQKKPIRQAEVEAILREAELGI